MNPSIRKQRRERGYARCIDCQADFTGRSQRKAEAKWREHYVEEHLEEPIDPTVEAVLPSDPMWQETP